MAGNSIPEVFPDKSKVEAAVATQEKPRRERGTGRLWRIGPIWYIQYYVHGRQVRES